MLAEQTDEFRLEEVLLVEAILDNLRHNLVEFFHGSAVFEEDGRWVLVNMAGNVGSLGEGVLD